VKFESAGVRNGYNATGVVDFHCAVLKPRDLRDLDKRRSVEVIDRLRTARCNSAIFSLAITTPEMFSGLTYHGDAVFVHRSIDAAVVREQGGGPVPRAHVELLTSENVLLGASETDRAAATLKKTWSPAVTF
jgi:hypothetical protein